MKYLCDACSRLVEVREFAVRDGSLSITCPQCGGPSVAPPPPQKPARVVELNPQPAADGPRCPKCGAPRAEGAAACARCGVVFELFNPENLAMPPALEELWTGLQARWGEAERHTEFLAACASAETLSEAARRYRMKAESSPQDELATRFRDEAVARLLAAASLPSAHEDPTPPLARRTRAAAVVLFFVASVALFLFVLSRIAGSPGPQP